MNLIGYSVRAEGFKTFCGRGRVRILYGTVLTCSLTVIWPHSPYIEAELMMMTDSRFVLSRCV